MSAWHPISEGERDRATLTRCEGQLRQAQEQVRGAREALKKALRGMTDAEDALGQATRRLDRTARVSVADVHRLWKENPCVRSSSPGS